MQLREKVDRTLVQRQAVQQLVHRVRDEGVALQELEEIGARLRGAGLYALNNLLRALGKEDDPEIISRYAYLLDFFDEEDWLSPLISITLRRRDLPEQGRGALLAALQEYGVDVDGPPFSSLLPSREPERDRGGELDDEALVSFLDDFLGYPTDLQLSAVDEVGREREPWVVRFLEAILWHEDPAVVQGALRALGRVELPEAAAALADFSRECDPSLVPLVELALRRLSFAGVEPPGVQAPLPFLHGFVSAPDGDGYRSLLISRGEGGEKVTALYMQVHERRGLLAAWGGEGLDIDAFEEEVQAFGDQEELYRVAPEYVVALVRDALYWSGDLSYLPADFYLRRRLFRGVDLTPRPFSPELEEYRMGRPLRYLEGERISEELLRDPFFGGWVFVQRRVYDLARQYREGQDREEVLALLCGELLAPQAELLAGRLMAVADLMRECGSACGKVAEVVALAHSIASYPLPYHLHPFLRRCAIESIEAAADVLDGGKRRAMAG